MYDISNRFYNPSKLYTLKHPIMSVNEKKFFKIMREKLGNNYIITPQINLQSIIETPLSNSRNDELFRNVDFGIFDTEMYHPLMLIEINGKQHSNEEYWRKRDKSVKEILESAGLMLYTINNEDLKGDTNKLTKEIIEIILKIDNLNFFI